MSKYLEGKAEMAYPEKIPKKKKIVRREIKIARVDTSNRELIQWLASMRGIHFPQTTMVFIIKDGRYSKYDGWFGQVEPLLLQMQRVFNPLIELTTVEEVVSFLETQPAEMYQGDFTGGLVNKDKELPFRAEMDNIV